MLAELETIILSAAQTLYVGWGWMGVAVLLVFENATRITPSEIILGLAGWMLIAEHQFSPSTVFLGGFYAALGSVAGASIAYWTARLGGRPLVDRLARLVGIKPAHIDRADTQFRHWGTGLVLIGRVVPGIRTLINIPAGLARMPFISFVVATFIGAYVWCTALIGAGYVLGHERAFVGGYLRHFMPHLLVAGAAALATYFWFNRRAFAPAVAPVGLDND